MYFYETILALLLSLCFFALFFPYLTPQARQLIGLTSVYRPISLAAFLVYGALILLRPISGPAPLFLTPFMVLIGTGAMALEARTKSGRGAQSLSAKKLFLILVGAVALGIGTAFLFGLRVCIIYFNLLVASSFAWLAIEARYLFRASRSFSAGAIVTSAVIAAFAMVVRATAYIEPPVSLAVAFFPDAPGGFVPRIVATFAAFFSTVAFNFEDLRLQAVKERSNAAALYGGLFQSLVKAIEGRTGQTESQTGLTAHCAALLTQKLQQHGWFNIPRSPEFAARVAKAAPLADLGLIGLPQHILSEELAPGSDAFQLFCRHPLIGKELLKGIVLQAMKQQVQGDENLDALELAAEIIEYRHENWDGSGFPHGKIAKEIPPATRIATVAADLVRFAQQSSRLEDAFQAIKEGADQKYDPLVVRVLIANEDAFADILSGRVKA